MATRELDFDEVVDLIRQRLSESTSENLCTLFNENFAEIGESLDYDSDAEAFQLETPDEIAEAEENRDRRRGLFGPEYKGEKF